MKTIRPIRSNNHEATRRPVEVLSNRHSCSVTGLFVQVGQFPVHKLYMRTTRSSRRNTNLRSPTCYLCIHINKKGNTTSLLPYGNRGSIRQVVHPRVPDMKNLNSQRLQVHSRPVPPKGPSSNKTCNKIRNVCSVTREQQQPAFTHRIPYPLVVCHISHIVYYGPHTSPRMSHLPSRSHVSLPQCHTSLVERRVALQKTAPPSSNAPMRCKIG